MATCEFYVAGQVKGTLDGKSVEASLRGLQGRVLFAYLVLNRGHAVSREALTDALWPGALPTDPAAALRTQLSRVRKAVGPERLGRGAEIQLELPEDSWVDVEEAERLLRSAATALTDGEKDAAIEGARAALELARPPFLPGFNAPWVDEVRHDLEELAYRSREAIARSALALGAAELPEAERAARAMIEYAPTRENGHALLIETLAASGRRAEALDAFEQLRQRLRALLGIEPGPELRALRANLLEHAGSEQPGGGPRPSIDPGPPPAAAPDGAPTADAAAEPVPEPPALPGWLTSDELGSFVGRGAELRRLREQWAEVRSGDRRVTLIRGEPGIGKTRLAVEFALAARRGQARVLYGRCDDQSVVPFQPFVESMRHYLRSRPPQPLEGRLAAHGRQLAHLVPEIESRLPPGAGGVPGGQGDRFRIFEAIDALLEGASRRIPTLLVLDDLHWADADTLLLLKHLIRSPRRSPLMMIGTYRSTEPGQPLLETIADLGHDGLFTRITLGGLNERETASMVSLLVGYELPEVFSRSLGEELGGNPFAIQAIVRHLTESGGLNPDSGIWPSGPSLYSAGIPEDLEQLFEERLSRFDERSRRVLRAAAVIGTEFDQGLLESLPGMQGREVLDAIEQAEAAGLVAAVSGQRAGYRFPHALIRESLYAALPVGSRSRLHRAVADALVSHGEADRGANAAEIARHYAAAGDDSAPAAAYYAALAGRRANDVQAYGSAAVHYRAALDATEKLDEAPRQDLLRLLGDAQHRAGDVDGARQSFRELADAARASGSVGELAHAALGFSGPPSATWGQRDQEAVSLLTEALLSEPADPAQRSRLLARLAQAMQFSDKPVAEQEAEEVDSLSREAIETARESGSSSALAGALSARVYVSYAPETIDERLELLDEIRSLIASGGARELLGHERSWRIGALLELGRIDEVDAEIARAEETDAESGRPAARIYRLIFRATRAQLAGRFGEADRLITEAEGLGDRARAPDVVQLLGAQRYYAQLMTGHAVENEPMIDRLMSGYPATISWRAGLLRAYTRQGREEEARAQLDEIMALGFPLRDPADSWLPAASAVAVAAEQLNEPEIAGKAYAALEPYAERIVVSGLFAICWGPGHRYLGISASTRSDWEAAEPHFESAVEIAERIGAPHWLAETRFDYASMLRRRGAEGDAAKAAGLLADAAEGAQTAGLLNLGKRIAAARGEPAERVS